MASPYLEWKIVESVREKRKYFAKVLSESAIWNNYLRTIDTEDYFAEWAWAEAMYFIWLDISNLFIFGLEPYEMEPLDPEFRTELPTIEEWKQGIKLKLIPLDLGEAWLLFYWDVFGQKVPPLLDFVALVMALCWPEYLGWLLEQKKRKLIVGESVYGTSYVDPPFVRDLIRSGLFEMARRRMDFRRIREAFETFVKGAGVAEGVVEAIYNRMALHFQVLFENFVLDFNLLNYSRLCSRSSEQAAVPVVTWRGEALDARYSKFEEINIGFVLDITPLNLGILMPRERVYKPSPRARWRVGTNAMSWFVDWKVRRMISRYRATGVALGNYQRPEETTHWTRSERADHHHQLRSFFYYLDGLVDSILEREDVDIFRRNMYRRAAAQLIGHKKKRHRWGYGVYRAMTEEEFKRWWIEYWERQGLKAELLNKIYERVITWLPSVRRSLEELGERLRRRREELARALA